MAQLDRLLPFLFSQAGAELRLAAGHEPTLEVNTQKTRVTPRVLEAVHVRFLIGEIVDAVSLHQLEQQGFLDFVYVPSGFPQVVVSVRDWHSDTAQVRVKPYATDALPALTPASRRSLPMQVEAGEPQATRRTTMVERSPPALSFDGLLRHLVEQGASDLHLSTGQPPNMRKHGSMMRILDLAPLSEEQLMKLIEPAIPARNREQFTEQNDTDFAHEIAGLSRFRINLFRDRKGPGLVARVVPNEILSAEQLGLSQAIRNLGQLAKGLVLVTGPTGSGKSTTLAALIDLINRERDDHIITLEDPIEFVHPSKKCFINQREVGVHTQDFKRALRAALREDPDIVLVGEMRDLETVAIAIETAETGHLVFGTLHTTTAISTVDRIIDQFPGERQEQIRAMLSESLKAVIAQTLCKKIGGGRVAALEVLLSTPAVANLIREGKTYQIPSVMQTSRKHGMVMLNDALLSLVQAQKIEPREAYAKAIDKHGMTTALSAAGHALESVLVNAEM
jgi:twitching motility protein PilT